jgi:hypothetical protein
MVRFGRNVRPGRHLRQDRRRLGATGPGKAPEDLYPASLDFLYPSPSRGRLWEDSILTDRASPTDPVGAREDYSGHVRHATQATTARKPTYVATGPSVDYDGADDLLKATYSLSLASKFAIMLAAWRANGINKFDLYPMTVANLTAEDYVAIEAGDVLVYPLSPWDEARWSASYWCNPAWDSDDGLTHVFWEIYLDADNWIQLIKTAAGDVRLRTRAGGTEKTADLTPITWAAGDEVFIGASFDGTDATLFFDTTEDGTLETQTIASVGTFLGGSYSAYLGSEQDLSNPGEGGLNLILLNDHRSAPITDRYDGGSGEAWATWKAEYGPYFSLALPDPTSSTLKALDSGLAGIAEEFEIVGINLELVE